MSLKVSQRLFYSSTRHVVIFTLSYTFSGLYLCFIEFICHDNTLQNNILFCTLFCFIISCNGEKKKKKACAIFKTLLQGQVSRTFIFALVEKNMSFKR